MIEDEMVWWYRHVNGHLFEWTPGVGDGQGGLVCCSPWGHKELDMTERLKWTELNWTDGVFLFMYCRHICAFLVKKVGLFCSSSTHQGPIFAPLWVLLVLVVVHGLSRLIHLEALWRTPLNFSWDSSMQSYWEVKKEKIAELPEVLLVLSFYLASISFINALILHDTRCRESWQGVCSYIHSFRGTDPSVCGWGRQAVKRQCGDWPRMLRSVVIFNGAC